MLDAASYVIGIKYGTGKVDLSEGEFAFQDDGEGNITIQESGE